MKKLLHVGCGRKRKEQTTAAFNTPDWKEIRLDIDVDVRPDIVGTLTDMAAVADGSVDAIFSSHNIEHLFPHEVPVALAEFRRVLSADGLVVVTCPDLKSVAKLIAEDKLTEPAYMSGMGPITPLDILYGHRASVAAGNTYMAHRGGFTLKSLLRAFQGAGFESVAGLERPRSFDLWVIASKAKIDDGALRALAATHLPMPPVRKPAKAAAATG
ncbi:MAG: class I SAM-dependent methyltransferase [Hyphomicrobiaceae bacterium]